MKLPFRAVLVAPLVLSCLGCVAAIGNRGTQTAPPDGGGKAAARKGDDADDADALRKKRRELEYARMEIDIARLAAQAEDRETEAAVKEATEKLEAAQKDLENFMNLERPTQVAGKELELDRSTWSMEESRQELAELEAMYKQEDFAELTKELVLQRGRKRLEFAQRGLELAKTGQQELLGHDLPKKEKDLTLAVEKAGRTLAEAQAKRERSALDSKLKLMKAEHKIDDLEREIEKLEAKTKEKTKGAEA